MTPWRVNPVSTSRVAETMTTVAGLRMVRSVFFEEGIVQRRFYRALEAFIIGLVLLAAPSAIAAERYALLIGNAEYEDAEPLYSPVNDIDLVGEALERSDFTITKVVDATALEMISALNRFTREASRAENPVVVVYYSGYSVQIDGENYLLPVDVSGRTQTGIRNRSLPVRQVADALEDLGTGIRVVLLDSAHRRPFEELRDLDEGLARPKDSGLLYGYAAAPGTVGDYDDSAISPFSSALADTLTIPGISLGEAFKRVRDTVKERTGGKQETWESSAQYGDLRFGRNGDKADDAEIAFYEFAALENNTASYDRYLARYPEGIFAYIAEKKIELLGKHFEPAHVDGGDFGLLTFANSERDPCGSFSFDSSDRHLGDRYKDGQLVLLDFRFWFPRESCDYLAYFSTVYAHERLRNVITSASIPERRIYVATRDDVSPSEERAIYDYFDDDRRGYAQSLMFRGIYDERRSSLAISVKSPSDEMREYIDEQDCGEYCLRFRALVRFQDRSGRHGEDYQFDFVDVRKLGLYDRYRDALRDFGHDSFASSEHASSSHQGGDAYSGNSGASDDGYGKEADPYRDVRKVGGWDVVAEFSNRKFLNCHASRRDRGDRLASFRWYPDGHLTFGYYDQTYDYRNDWKSEAKYWIDDGQGYDVRATAYSAQEVAYDLGSDRSVFDALRRGNTLRIGEERTSLKGSSAVLTDLQACVGAFR
jgi:hypothetical protein